VAQLRIDLKAQGLGVAGNKAALVQRLLGSSQGGLTALPSPPPTRSPLRESAAAAAAAEGAGATARAALLAKLSSMAELKASLRSRGLPVSGAKAACAARLARALRVEAAAEDRDEQDADERAAAAAKVITTAPLRPPPAASAPRTGSLPVLAAGTLAELRAQLRARGLPMAGNKAALVDRLRRARAQDAGAVR